VVTVHGFVEELVVRKDPEHGLAELVRSSVASNEERQRVFHKLATEVRRNVGVKARDKGGNAVIGYRQEVDMEENGVLTARGYGTAVTLRTDKELRRGNVQQQLPASPKRLSAIVAVPPSPMALPQSVSLPELPNDARLAPPVLGSPLMRASNASDTQLPPLAGSLSLGASPRAAAALSARAGSPHPIGRRAELQRSVLRHRGRRACEPHFATHSAARHSQETVA
jgi:hypothetical protein